MKLLDINSTQVELLKKNAMNINHLWVLHGIMQDLFPVRVSKQITKVLEDRGLIRGENITAAGKEFYEKVCNTKLETSATKSKKEVVQKNRFDEWYEEVYPSSANFTIRGMKFTSSRALRSNRQVCNMLYNSAIAQGDITEEQIINATRYMVNQAKEESFESGTNKLQYLPGSEVFLRQARYLSFLDIVQEINEEESNNWA